MKFQNVVLLSLVLSSAFWATLGVQLDESKQEDNTMMGTTTTKSSTTTDGIDRRGLLRGGGVLPDDAVDTESVVVRSLEQDPEEPIIDEGRHGRELLYPGLQGCSCPQAGSHRIWMNIQSRSHGTWLRAHTGNADQGGNHVDLAGGSPGPYQRWQCIDHGAYQLL